MGTGTKDAPAGEIAIDRPSGDGPAPTPIAAARGRGPKPPEDVPWRHQDGCTNPVSDDWGCACGPEVIPA